MKRYIILIAALLATLSANAQVSGYMGRRFSVTLDGSIGLKNDPQGVDFFSFFRTFSPDRFGITPTLTFDYVLPDNYSAVVRINPHRHDTLATITPFTNYSIELGMRHYKDLAPQGTFWGVGLLANYLNYDIENDMKKTKFGVQFEYGRNYIFFDYLLLHIGAKFSMMMANPMRKKFNLDSYPSEVLKEHRVNGALWMDNLILLEVGLGVLPF